MFHLPSMLITGPLASTSSSDPRRRTCHNHKKSILSPEITLRIDNAHFSESRAYGLAPLLHRGTTKAHSELTNQLPQVIRSIVCVAQHQPLHYGLCFIFFFFDHAYYAFPCLGNDGYLIPTFKFCLICSFWFIFDSSFLPMPSFKYYKFRIGQANLYVLNSSLFFYVCKFGLSSYDSTLDPLVKFSDTSLLSQDLYKDYAGLIPTKINSDFCWLTPSVILKSSLEFINLLNGMGMNLEIQTQTDPLFKNFKRRLDQGNLNVSKPIYIKSSAPRKHKNNLIKFPMPRV
jgi:hypothetical protein